MARLWIVDETLTKADAIIVLGGSIQTRPFAAAKVYHEGLAPKIIVMDAEWSPTDRMGLTRHDAQVITEVLLREGVPRDAITLVREFTAESAENAGS